MNPETAVLISVVVSGLSVVVLLIVVSKLVALNKGLQRLSEQIPGTGATAKEIADELGGSIESSFEKFMPKPEKVSDAITGAVESSLKSAATGLGDVEKAISTAAGALSSGLSEGSDKLKSSLVEGSSKLETVLSGGSEKLASSLSDGSKKLTEALSSGSSNLEAALKEHAEKTAQANKELSAQLDKIATLEKEIDKLLHIQEATEGTMKSVTASDEFKNLVTGLRTHLESSDAVLKELTKPRQIRLVEEE